MITNETKIFMPLKMPQPGSPEDWLWHAGSDLALACISKPDGVLLEELCFHSQQALILAKRVFAWAETMIK